MPKPAQFGFFSNLVVITGFTVSALVPMAMMDVLPLPFTHHTPAHHAKSLAPAAVPGGLLGLVNIEQAQAADGSDTASPGADKLNTLYQQLSNPAQPETASGHPDPAVQPVASPAVPIVAVVSMPVPVGFDAPWGLVLLDEGKLRLQVLKHGYTLAQTQNQAGAEYFDYSAGIFGQMATQVDDPLLSRQLARLDVEAEAMGHEVRQATALRFDGHPDDNMTHLKVRSAILDQLAQLNTRPAEVVDLDENGQSIAQSAAFTAVPGPSLEAYEATLTAIRNNPAARQRYPQMLSVINHQSKVLTQLAMGLQLHWESAFNCNSHVSGQCDARHLETSRMRLYVVQNASSRQVDLATEVSIYLWLNT